MPANDKKDTPVITEESSGWDNDQEKNLWKKEYQNLKNELAQLTPDKDALGELDSISGLQTVPNGHEKRAEPRYQFKKETQVSIFAHIGPKAFQILNISVGGVAFYSDVFFEPGTSLLLSALGMVALDVEVLSCELEETNPDFMEFNYLVRAKFSERVNGYLVYVLSREMYLKQLQMENPDGLE